MSVEEELREMIVTKFRSVLNFSKVVDMPCSTVENILRRGVQNASVTRIIAICQALGIDTDALADGRIEESKPRGYSVDEIVLIKAYRELNEEGKAMARSHINFLRTQPLYKKCNINDLVEENA